MNATASFTDILDILACPKCHGPLAVLEDDKGQGLACAACSVVYPVAEGIPVLLVEEAVPRRKWETADRQ
jgi:uncharacterized protein YbaR (Trm112 family)